MRLWGEHLDLSASCRELVKTGISKQGDAFAGFPADLHARLYLPSEPQETGTAPDWAAQLHGLATETAEWNQLKLMTARNGFAAGIAAEIMLEHLLPHVPEQPTPQPPSCASPPGPLSGRRRGGANSDADHRQEGGAGPGDTPSLAGKGTGDGGTGTRQANSGPSPEQTAGAAGAADLRAALRKAAREARNAVQDAESGLEGLSTPLGIFAGIVGGALLGGIVEPGMGFVDVFLWPWGG